MDTEEMTSDPLFSTVARDSVHSTLHQIAAHWEGVRAADDIEAVHDMRVATRRLRASLSVFQSSFPARPFEKFERKIEYLTDALGDARDTDVFMEFMQAQIDSLTPEQSAEEYGLKEFMKHLVKRREQQQSDLLKTLRRLDPAELVKDGQSLLNTLPQEPAEPGTIDVV
jgi:CHAD domain-containing protein